MKKLILSLLFISSAFSQESYILAIATAHRDASSELLIQQSSQYGSHPKLSANDFATGQIELSFSVFISTLQPLQLFHPSCCMR